MITLKLVSSVHLSGLKKEEKQDNKLLIEFFFYFILKYKLEVDFDKRRRMVKMK